MNEPLQLSAREIPIPAALSAEARKALTSPRAPLPALPAIDDHVGWETFANHFNSQLAIATTPALSNFSVDVTKECIAGVVVHVGRPLHAAEEPHQVLLHLHGGGFVLGGGDPNVHFEAAYVAQRTGRITYAIDYSVPPGHPFPAALDESLAVYRALLETRGSRQLVLSGTSAGGNLAAALLLKIRDAHLTMPTGTILLSPQADLTESGDSFHTLMGLDTRLTSRLTVMNQLYAGTRELTDPYISPLFGDFTGCSPVFLQSGTRDLFLSNTVRLHRRMRSSGVCAELHVWDGMPHIGFGGMTDEDREVDSEIRMFLDKLPGHIGI